MHRRVELRSLAELLVLICYLVENVRIPTNDKRAGRRMITRKHGEIDGGPR